MGEVGKPCTYSVTFEFWFIMLLVVVEALWLGFLGTVVFRCDICLTEVVLLSAVGYVGCRQDSFFEMLKEVFGKKRKGSS